jgi:hypothetical protein
MGLPFLLSTIQPNRGYLPVIHFSESTHQIEDFNPKSTENQENRRKTLQFLKSKIPLLHQLVITYLGQQHKNPVGKLYNLEVW